jgi:extracellular elastinolytic metalloproteinase
MNIFRGEFRGSVFAQTAVAGLIVASVSLATPAFSQSPATGQRHYDARTELSSDLGAPAPAVEQGLQRLFLAIDDLAVTRDEWTGGVKSLSSHTGYLTTESGFDPLFVGLEFLRANSDVFGFVPDDLKYEVTDSVYSAVTGATHIYLRQLHRGLPVYNGQLQFNVNREGRLLSVHNAFVPSIAEQTNSLEPEVGLAAAVGVAAADAGLRPAVPSGALSAAGDERQITTLQQPSVSLAPIDGELMWLPTRPGEVRLVWRFQIHTPDAQHIYDYTMDAQNGQVWTRTDWVASDSYRVYELPAESPNHTSGRTLVANPADGTASPFGWHDTNGSSGAEFTVTRGNNAYAYTDIDANNSPDAGSSPSGGSSLVFDFALNLGQAPSNYRPAAVTNLFYLNNVIHDIQYQYGFDEPAGNFQINNYGNGGNGNDSVLAEAQDGSGTNNANFGTPPDGSSPRMQMFVWTAPNPDRDGDLDASIVIHEYGHGISNRLVGGPSNVGCLGNNQQPGEGLSDWWALVLTAQVGDQGTDGRGIGTYALNQATTGAGIRTQRYSTSPSINTWTYENVQGSAIPHGVGEKWAQAAWEVYWALVDAHGFDADLYNATGGAGNQRAMLYVNEGLKNTSCSPTFTAVRDGIIQAATDNFGGADVCLIWEAFAGYGLGTDAISGGSNSTNPTNGFSIPTSCLGNQPPVADAGPNQVVQAGATVTLNGSGSSDPDSNPLTYGWTQIAGPGVTINNANQVTASFVAALEGSYTMRLTVSDGEFTDSDDVGITVTGVGGGDVFFDDFSSDLGWTTNPNGADTATTGDWERADPQPTASGSTAQQLGDAFSPNNDLVTGATAGSSVGSNDIDNGVTSIQSPAIALPSEGSSTLSFAYYLAHLNNATSADFLRVQIVGATTTTVFEELGAANTDAGAWETTSVSLDAFAGQTIRILISAADASGGSLVEAGIDDVRIVNAPVSSGDVFVDDFETNKGWTLNPSGSDTASTGLWQRANPESTASGSTPLQLGTTVSGNNDLVTGATAGSSAGTNDIDNGVTSIQSPLIDLPASGTLTLSFSYYLAHLNNATSADFLRVQVVGASTSTVFEELGAGNTDAGAWASTNVDISAFAGQSIRILISAADASGGSLVEAGIDDLSIIQE